jgi:hypothetical protein
VVGDLLRFSVSDGIAATRPGCSLGNNQRVPNKNQSTENWRNTRANYYAAVAVPILADLSSSLPFSFIESCRNCAFRGGY